MVTRIKRSWAITGIFCLLATAISVYVNLVLYEEYNGIIQPGFIRYLHIAAAFMGAGLLARFIQGSRHVMDESAPGTVVGTYFIPRAGEYVTRVRGTSAFFSTRRVAQLLGFVICLMSQFVFTAAPDEPSGPVRYINQPAVRLLPA
ncbi:hypothetical protein [Paraburkholderia sp. JHI869]|uniref:hypothetical protein n=1 Tax=Paraburkholderia sp. JHI869 TaxID=3112959 RepID=UPI00317A057C